MGGKDWRFPGSPCSTTQFSINRMETKGCDDDDDDDDVAGRQDLVFLGSTIHFPSYRKGRQKIMVGNKNWRFPGNPDSTIRFPNYRKKHKRKFRRKTRTGDFLAWETRTRQDHPVPKHGRATRRDCDCRTADNFPEALAAASGSQAARRDSDKRQGLAIPRGSRQHHPALKLRERKQEEIVMGDKDWQFPGSPGRTIRFPSYRREL